MLHPFLANEVFLFIQILFVSIFSLKKGRGHQVLRGPEAPLSDSEKSFLSSLLQFHDPRINDLAIESVVKSIDIDAVLAVEE